jgi:hypothetical protein
MGHERGYVEAIEACNRCIREDDRANTWWPKVLRIEGSRTVLDVDGTECAAFSDVDVAHSSALFRLMLDDRRVCALFAYPAESGVKPVDVVVGFLDGDGRLTLALNDKEVFPMIGNRDPPPEIPPATRWIVAAALGTEHRRAVSAFKST